MTLHSPGVADQAVPHRPVLSVSVALHTASRVGFAPVLTERIPVAAALFLSMKKNSKYYKLITRCLGELK